MIVPAEMCECPVHLGTIVSSLVPADARVVGRRPVRSEAQGTSMRRHNQLQMFLHGGILLMGGSLLGLPFFGALTEDSGQNVVQFWRGAHTGVIAAGVWLIATGAASSHLKLTERSGWVLAWSTILSNYFAVAALLVKVAVGATDSTRLGLHGLAHACYLAVGVSAAVLALVSVSLVIVGSQAALRQARASS